VSLAGTRHVMKKGRLMVQPADVELTIHAPIPTAGVARTDVIAFAERVRAVVVADAR